MTLNPIAFNFNALNTSFFSSSTSSFSPHINTININHIYPHRLSHMHRYTYLRTGRSLVATYFISAFWHGLYPGFFLFFMSIPLMTNIERLIKVTYYLIHTFDSFTRRLTHILSHTNNHSFSHSLFFFFPPFYHPCLVHVLYCITSIIPRHSLYLPYWTADQSQN
jgi:MBOAT, membrane-bound O-acyltransferase family